MKLAEAVTAKRLHISGFEVCRMRHEHHSEQQCVMAAADAAGLPGRFVAWPGLDLPISWAGG